MINCDVAIIGAGPAGLNAALGAKAQGARSIVILERDSVAGGILNQCIHAGFALMQLGQELTGPEYSFRLIQDCAKHTDIHFITQALVTGVQPGRTPSEPLTINYIHAQGIGELHARATILTTGCRERPRGQIHLPGTRPAGIFTAGLAQKLTNMQGLMPGKNVVILGSGDIGLIMARRMTLLGAKVKAVIELNAIPSGLPRNLIQCLEDFDIPLFLSHTVTEIFGQDRLCAVEMSQVDRQLKVIPNTRTRIECDTLILSVGLIPENEVAESAGCQINPTTNSPLIDQYYQTSVPNLFCAGNALHVHDLVDDLAEECRTVGRLAARAAQIVQGALPLPPCPRTLEAKGPLRYFLPQTISGHEPFTLKFRVTRPLKRARLQIGEQSYSLHNLVPYKLNQLEISTNGLTTSSMVGIEPKVQLCLTEL